MKIRIIHTQGARSGEVDEISGSQVLLGRDPSCHVVFDGTRDDAVSSQHAMLTVINEDVIVSDLGSRNGTLVNGRPINTPVKVPVSTAVVRLGRGGPSIKLEVVPDAPAREPAPAAHGGAVAVGRVAVDAFGHSDMGPRPDNQDAFFADPPLFLVADGCGGHKGGQLASRLTIDTLVECFSNPVSASEALAIRGERRRTPNEHEIASWFRLANKRVWERGERDMSIRGLGTTLVAAWIVDDELVVGNCGDSRLYRIRDGQIEQLTEDDSLVSQLCRDGIIGRDEMEKHPDKNILMASIGMKSAVEAKTAAHRMRAEDVYVLCSDGVHGSLPDAEVGGIVLEQGSRPDACARELVAQAIARGSQDNTTAVVFRIASAP